MDFTNSKKTDFTYSKTSLDRMNCSYPWNGSIKHSELKPKFNNSNNSNLYKLHATGDCNISNGRVYISLPADLKINDDVKKKYNLM